MEYCAPIARESVANAANAAAPTSWGICGGGGKGATPCRTRPTGKGAKGLSKGIAGISPTGMGGGNGRRRAGGACDGRGGGGVGGRSSGFTRLNDLNYFRSLVGIVT